METLEKILGDFMNLVQSINFPNGKYQIVMKYGDQIRPIVDKSNKITIVPYENGLCVYEISRENSLETLAVFIKKTIDYNVEAKAKGKLYNQKVKELEAIFTEHTLQELEGLRFVLGDGKDEMSADKAVNFEAKLDDIEMSAEEIEEEPKKTSKKGKKQEKRQTDIISQKSPEASEANIMNTPPVLNQPTGVIDSQESIIMSTATTKTEGLMAGQVDIKL